MILTIPDIIKKKRDKKELDAGDINFFIRSVVDGTANDAQIGAWLMAVYLNGMNHRETTDLTKAMVDSGERLKWDVPWSDLIVDKHSTGGVGDKISLVLAPALAACGLKVPMLSGRGLGLTGGTLDKLESIPGFRVILSFEEMRNILEEVGCFIAGQTDSIALADKILYRHRDVTNTVDSMPLIASSILSKKAAEGTKTLVMDVKVGCGASLKNEREAEELACTLINVSKLFGIETSVVLSDMNIPIGCCVGNALEVWESIECLKNRGSEDVKILVTTLGGLILLRKNLVNSMEEGKKKIEETLSNGTALRKFQKMLVKQGVQEVTAVKLCSGDSYSTVIPKAKFVTTYTTEKSGIISSINAAEIAMASWYLGAGRSQSGSSIDHAVGIKLLKSVGEKVTNREKWIEIHHSQEEIDEHIKLLIQNCLSIDEHTRKTPEWFRILKVY